MKAEECVKALMKGKAYKDLTWRELTEILDFHYRERDAVTARLKMLKAKLAEAEKEIVEAARTVINDPLSPKEMIRHARRELRERGIKP